MITKTCTKCLVEKDLDSFHLHKSCKHGRAPECKECKSARSCGHYDKNRTEILNRRRAYKDAHREEISARDRAYREANREKIAAYNRAYHKANREKLNAQNRARYEANRDKGIAYRRDYFNAHREEINAQNRARYELIGNPAADKYQEISLKHATRKGEPWSEEEDRYLANSTARAIDDALALQRTFSSVQARRQHLRRAGVIEKQSA